VTRPWNGSARKPPDPMNTLSDFFTFMPVFAFGLIATIAAMLALLPFAFAKLGKPLRVLLSGALLAVSVGATAAAFRAQQQENDRTSRIVDSFMAMRLRNQIFILEKTAELPLDLERLSRVAPNAGGIAGMSAQEVAKWRAEKLASAKNGLAEILGRRPGWSN